MKLMAIDGNSLVNRAFYGVKAGLTSDGGVPTNALYGFLNMLFKLREDLSPDQICVCFDRREKTYRHVEYEGYKAQRKPMPEELSVQMPLVKEVLGLLGISCLEMAGYEADDLLGTIADKADNCVIVTGDKDSLQFITDTSTVCLITTKMGQTITEEYDAALFAEKYRGLTPDKIVDLKAIMGDSSDNIPGVKGIGEKGAMDLLERFGSLDGIYENIDHESITASMRKKLEEGKDMAYLSYKLATGMRDAPVENPDFTIQPVNEAALYEFLDKYRLRSIAKRLELKKPESLTATDFEPSDFSVVEDERHLETMSAAVKKCKYFILAEEGGLSSISIMAGGKTWVISQEAAALYNATFESIIDWGRAVIYGGRELYIHLHAAGIVMQKPLFDLRLAGYLLNPSSGEFSIEELALKYLKYEIKPEDDEGYAYSLFDDNTDELPKKTAVKAQVMNSLYDIFSKELESQGMQSLLTDIEIPLMMRLAQMQVCGMQVDGKGLLQFGEELKSDLDNLEAEIYSLAGEEFNIGSPKQLGVVLFDKLGLKGSKKTKSGFSTNADVLEKIKDRHPVIPVILEYRMLSKLKSTYVDGLVKLIDKKGRIHSTFHQTVTATGRISSAEPNMQNIPVRSKRGSEMRRFFTAAPGHMLVDADYSQIELRILAHIADDSVMLNAFKNGDDIHTITASQVFDMPADRVTPAMRSSAKAVNFGIVYGISAFSLSEDIGVTPKEAQRYIDAYFEKYPGVKSYMDKIRQQAKDDGYVTTLFGRRRYLPEIRSSNFNIRSFGERVALNTPIQGTAADIIKIAMVNVTDRLEKEKMSTRLILQIHDELILEAPEAELATAAALLQEEMENAAQLNVRLAADVSWGKNWYEAKK